MAGGRGLLRSNRAAGEHRGPLNHRGTDSCCLASGRNPHEALWHARHDAAGDRCADRAGEQLLAILGGVGGGGVGHRHDRFHRRRCFVRRFGLGFRPAWPFSFAWAVWASSGGFLFARVDFAESPAPSEVSSDSRVKSSRPEPPPEPSSETWSPGPAVMAVLAIGSVSISSSSSSNTPDAGLAVMTVPSSFSLGLTPRGSRPSMLVPVPAASARLGSRHRYFERDPPVSPFAADFPESLSTSSAL